MQFLRIHCNGMSKFLKKNCYSMGVRSGKYGCCIPCRWASAMTSCQHLSNYYHEAELDLVDTTMPDAFCLTDFMLLMVRMLRLDTVMHKGNRGSPNSQHNTLLMQFRFWEVFFCFVMTK